MTFWQKEGMELWDISPMLSKDTAVFPGDCSFQHQISMDTRKGDHLTLSEMRSTFHIGAHADAPLHYHAKGQDISLRNPHYYIGLCQVVEVKLEASARITLNHLSETQKKEIKAPRVLFKTSSFPNPNQWNETFNSLSPELIEWLSKKGVILVGIDTPSVDPFDSKKLESHQMIFEKDLAILEGLDLTDVRSGFYFLSALPIKVSGADAGYVRAVLLKGNLEKGLT